MGGAVSGAGRALSAIRSKLARRGDGDRAKLLRRFFKTGPGEYGEGDRFLGVTVPEVRKLAKEHKDLPWSVVGGLLKSPVHEDRLLALLILVLKFSRGDERGRERICGFYLKNAKHVNNWDLVDLSAGRIVGEFLLNRDKSILYGLARSDNRWERRISIIATSAFIRRGEYSHTLGVADALLEDKEDLIHKAVGWMLREVGKKDLRAEEEFLKPRCKRMPRTMLRYAIERFPEPKRQRYLRGAVKVGPGGRQKAAEAAPDPVPDATPEEGRRARVPARARSLKEAQAKRTPIALAIETATEVCGAAIADAGGIRAEAVIRAGLSHSSRLMELVRRVMADACVDLSEIGVLAVSQGPGSFTGIRIGMGAAIGLAAGAGVPVVGVPTLDALAWRQKPFDGLICAFMDARRGEVYYCLYEARGHDLTRWGEYAVRPPTAMISDVAKAVKSHSSATKLLLAGPVSLLEKSGMETAWPEGTVVATGERAWPTPGAVAALGLEMHLRGESTGPDSLKPIYVRRSDAELKRA